MRRKEREVWDINELLSIVQECRICHLGMQDEKGVYIVPLNYGFEYLNETLTLYFHSANVGRKIDALKKNNSVCIEMDEKMINSVTVYKVVVADFSGKYHK